MRGSRAYMFEYSIPRMLRLYWTNNLRLLNGCFVLSERNG
jgi:hypothetical protein